MRLLICLILFLVLSFNKSTDAINYAKCCGRESVPGNCISHCSWPLTMPNETDTCYEHFYKILHCVSGGMNLTNCCRRRGVEVDCLERCVSHRRQTTSCESADDKCIAYNEAIVTCFREYSLPRLPPTIIRSPPETVTYRTGGSVELDCMAEGTPEVTRCQWKKDGVYLNRSGSVDDDLCSNGTLELHSLKDNDEGVYQCFASNDYGTAVSQATQLRRLFTETEPLTGVTPRFEIREGMPFVMPFNPRRKSFPKPGFRWIANSWVANKGSTEVQLSERIQINEHGDLHFAYVKYEDGDARYDPYSINHQLKVEVNSISASLIVIRAALTPPLVPRVSFSSDASSFVSPGRNVSLRCFFSGFPEPLITWKRVGDDVSLPDGKYELENFNTTMTIYDVDESDEGRYQCIGSNIAGESFTQFAIVVEGEPTFRSTNSSLRNVNITEGSSVTFDCDTISRPEVTTNWFLNGMTIDDNNLPERFEFSNDKKTLTIRDVCRDCLDRETKTDLMVIQCNASNIHGYAFRSGYLNVLARTRTSIEGKLRILLDSANYNLRRFRCKTTSDPSTQSKSTWYFRQNGVLVPLEDSESFGTGTMGSPISVKNDILMIMVPGNDSKIWEMFPRVFICIGRNGYSQDEDEMALNVNAEVELDLAQVPGNGSLQEGQRVQFVCSFRYLSFLSPVKIQNFRWFLDAKEISPSGRRISIDTNKNFNRFNSTNSTITFQTVLPPDSGLVRCVVEYSSRLNLVISRDFYMQVFPRPAVSIDPLTMDVFATDNFTISCTVSNLAQQPGTRVTFSWFQDGQLASSYDSQFPKTTKQWSLATEEGLVVIGCLAKTFYGTSALQTSSINILKPMDEVCLTEYNADQSIVWPQAKVGARVLQPCPDNATGVCSRTCNKNGSGQPSWSAPDCKNCVSRKLRTVLDEIDRLEDGIGLNNQDDVAEVARSLSSITNTTDGLIVGDLEASVDAVDRLSRLRCDYQDLPNRDEISAVMKAMSNMLHPNNKQTWNFLNQNNRSAAAKLLTSADAYGRSLSLVANQTASSREVTDFIVLEAGSWRLDDLPSEITFPQTKETFWNEDRDDRITIPITAFDEGQWSANSTLSVWAVYYRNMDNYLPETSEKVLNSRVLSLTVKDMASGQTLKQPVSIILQHNTMEGAKNTKKCVFWDFVSDHEGTWSEVGCKVVTSDSNRTICSCNHLTNFAILMSLNPNNDSVLSIVSTVGCSISVAALILTIIIYAVTWKQVKSHQAAVLLNLCVALIVANIVFLAGADKVDPKNGCKVVAVLLHYFFLAAFFIMLAEGVQLLIYVVFVFHAKRKLETILLIVSAWVLPLIIVVISLGATKTVGYGNEQACWLSIQNNLIWAFIGPALTIIVINAVIIIVVLVRISATRLASSKSDSKTKIRGMVWNIAVICPVLGITWLFGVLSVSLDIIAFQYIFAIANSLQGIFIFIFHAVLNNKRINDRLSSLVSQYVASNRSSTDDSKRKIGQTEANKKPNKMKTDTNQANCYKELQNESFSDSGGKKAFSVESSTTFTSISFDKSISESVTISSDVTINSSSNV